MDSVLRLNSGQMIVLGGLMQEREQEEHAGIPGLSEVPLLGALFKGKSVENRMIELVILLKATILNV
ncbi:MAG: hypothetical protein HOI80_06535 [Alphaproteobacteria bacterium]|jgi:MSHA biogenesis protein MshL|nr:hypothetical protein [Alphaproteobacteria bacterium]MBT5390100.1 hypothetical protein [Alphaproteobacteria bacterium]MBT5540107.1 hypothetical protein [Alphaproteobacteria bacterium]MBT5655132.1 hypothetical protein [Alphaproteobacteria bacterium]